MIDILRLTVSLVETVVKNVEHVRANCAECEALSDQAERTLVVLGRVDSDMLLSDPLITSVIQGVHDALEEVSEAIQDCCDTGFWCAFILHGTHSAALRAASTSLTNAVAQIPLLSFTVITDVRSDLVSQVESRRRGKLFNTAASKHNTDQIHKALTTVRAEAQQELNEIKEKIQELIQKKGLQSETFDPLESTSSLVQGISSSLARVGTNKRECKSLVDFSKSTLDILQRLKSRTSIEPSLLDAIYHINKALSIIWKSISECGGKSFVLGSDSKSQHSQKLAKAAAELHTAIVMVSHISTSLPEDIRYDLDYLANRILQAKFSKASQNDPLAISFKKSIERVFTESGKGNREVRNLVLEFVSSQVSSLEQVRKVMTMFKQDTIETRRERQVQKQKENDLNQIIQVLSKVLDDLSEPPEPTQDLKDRLCCPISKEIMKDPVTLKDSGITYDRSSIELWLVRGYRYDPLTNVRLTSTELIPNGELQDVCKLFLKQPGTSSSAVSTSQAEEYQPRFVPGLYEGHGKIDMGPPALHVFQLLILDPSGGVVSCSTYRDNPVTEQANRVEIGNGEWNESFLDMSIKDPKCNYTGSVVSLDPNDGHLKIKWKGKVSKGASRSTYNFVFVYSPPPIQRVLWPRPGILQLAECAIMDRSNIKYKSQLVVTLEVDTTASGWMCFESPLRVSKLHDTKHVGLIMDGTWDLDGNLEFNVCFPLPGSPLYPHSKRANYVAKFHVMGNFVQSEGVFLPSFVAKISRIVEEGTSSSTPLEFVEVLKYPYLREASTPWFHFHPNPLKLFQTPTNYEMENGDYCIRADFDSSEGCVSYYLHARGWSSESIADHDIRVSWLNSKDNQYATSWISPDIWSIDKSSNANRYKISLSKSCKGLSGRVGYARKAVIVKHLNNVNENQVGYRLFVENTSRNENQCEWTIEKRHGCLYLVLEADHNSAFIDSDDYFLSHPVLESHQWQSQRPLASLSQDPKDALRITFEKPTK